MGSRLEIFAKQFVYSQEAAPMVTGADVISHMHAVIKTLKMIGCQKMITVDRFKAVVNKVWAKPVMYVLISTRCLMRPTKTKSGHLKLFFIVQSCGRDICIINVFYFLLLASFTTSGLLLSLLACVLCFVINFS